MFAALDLGTNNCRLLIAEPEGQNYKVVDTFSRSVRLGTGVWQNDNVISKEALDRTFEALTECAEKINNYPIERKRFVTTEACRYAENSHLLIDRVKKELNMSIKIISQQEEARLATLAVISLLEKGYDRVLLFDIGGGSTELVWLNLKSGIFKKGGYWLPEVVAWRSLPKGVVSLADQYKLDVEPEQYNNVVKETHNEIKSFYDDIKRLDTKDWKSFYLLGTSGTVTTLAALSLRMKKYNRFAVDGLWMHDQTIMDIIHNIRKGDAGDYYKNSFVGMQSPDLMISGCAILQAILEFFPSIRLRAADRGIREGIIYDLMIEEENKKHKKKKK